MTAEELRLTRSSPVVRKIAAEHQVDIRGIPGSGVGGRVTKQDILGHLEARPAAAPAPSPAPPPSAPGSRTEVVPMSPIRRKTAEHMVLSKRTSAHVSTVFEVDLTRIAQFRQKHRASFEERGVRLTFMPFVLNAVVDALKVFPVLNASIDGENIVYRKDINLGIAVALDWGLIVPVIHHADYYPEDMITDQTERFLVSEVIREKVIEQTFQEIPYSTAVTIESFEEHPEKNLVVIKATIHVERISQKKILIGKGGQKLKQIGEMARKAMEAFLEKKVFLELWVNVERNWTQDLPALNRLGYPSVLTRRN